MIPEVVAEAAERYGDRAAVVSSVGWTLTYADLDALSAEAAAGLIHRGVGPGDVVALCLPSAPEYVVAYAAVAKVGAATAGVNPRLTPAERSACLTAARPTLTLATTDLLPGEAGKVLEVERATNVDSILPNLRLHGITAPAVPVLDVDPTRVVSVVFTSGTTGNPKGAVFTNTQLSAIEAADTGGTATWGAGSDQLAATQFAHVGTMTKLPWQLRSGATFHLLARWRAADALAKLAELKVPVVAGVPPQIALMLRDPTFDDHDWSHVHGIVAGGGPATPALVAEAQERFGAPFSIRYSSTESGGVGCGTSFDAADEERLETVGRPRGPVEMSLRDDTGTVVADGDVGEVCFRSPAACIGYWRDEAASAALGWSDGFVRMSDEGRVLTGGAAAGCLQLVGRTKEMFVRGGYNVYPMEVEAVLAAHPAVAEVAIVPRSDDVMGDIGVAVVVPRSTARPPSLDELRELGATRLSNHKLPEALEIAEALPRTAMDKLDRGQLTREFA